MGNYNSANLDNDTVITNAGIFGCQSLDGSKCEKSAEKHGISNLLRISNDNYLPQCSKPDNNYLIVFDENQKLNTHE